MTNSFINLLNRNGISIVDISNNIWVYAGGDYKQHLKYFINNFKQKYGVNNCPYFKNKCICNHTIKYNCYIYNSQSKRFVVLGKCCLKKFLVIKKNSNVNACIHTFLANHTNTQHMHPCNITRPARHSGISDKGTFITPAPKLH